MAEELTTIVEVQRAINLLEQEIATRRQENDGLNARIMDNNVFCGQARARLKDLHTQMQSMQATEFVLSQTQLAEKARADAELMKSEVAAIKEQQQKQLESLAEKHRLADELLEKANKAAEQANAALAALPSEG